MSKSVLFELDELCLVHTLINLELQKCKSCKVKEHGCKRKCYYGVLKRVFSVLDDALYHSCL